MSTRKLLWIPLVGLVAWLVWRPLSGAGEPVTPAAPVRSVVPESGPSLTRPADDGVVRLAASQERKHVGAASEPARAATSLLVTVHRRGLAQPVSGARVWLPGPQQESAAAATDGDGRIELAVPPGVPLTLAVAEGRGAAAAPFLFPVPALDAGEHGACTLELPVPFWCRLVAAESGLPVGGADVLSNDASVGELRSAADGRFRLPVVSHYGQRVARIEAPGYAPARVAAVDGYEDPERPLEVPLERAAALEPTLVDAREQPVEQAQVTLLVRGAAIGHPTSAGWTGGHQKILAVSDHQGRFRVDGLPPAVPIEVSVSSSAGSELTPRGPLVLQPGELARPVWRIGGAGSVSGVLLDERGAPVPEREIWLCRPRSERRAGYLNYDEDVVARANTDPAGRFRLQSIAPGAWWVGLAPAPPEANAPPEAGFAHVALRIELRSDEELECTLRTSRGLVISGRVRTPEGQPARRGPVFCKPLDGDGFVLGAFADGVFSAGSLAPGPHRVYALCGETGRVSQTVEAAAGDTDVLLTLQARGAVHIEVLDAETGAPAVRPRIQAFDRGAPGPFVASSQVLAGSAGVRLALSPGVFDIGARTEDGRFGLAAGFAAEPRADEKLQIQVSPGAQVRVRFQGGPPRADCLIFQGESQVAFARIVQGSWKVETVPAGALQIELARDGQSLARQQAYLAPGRSLDVQFELD